ncbi:MAG: hypothetical protein K0R08_246 [Solimicrobium sp.]|jgi:hypothetical protein|nr:hypothetical protein [Solimicrobium sp.]
MIQSKYVPKFIKRLYLPTVAPDVVPDKMVNKAAAEADNVESTKEMHTTLDQKPFLEKSEVGADEYFMVESECTVAVDNYKSELLYLKSAVLNENFGLSRLSFNVALREFCKTKLPAAEYQISSNPIVTKDLVIYTFPIQGDVKAEEWRRQHATGKYQSKIALIPYFSFDTEDLIDGKSEDHVTLLVLDESKFVLIDPKLGIKHGLDGLILEDNIQALLWQSEFTEANSGFYVYHMVTEMITRSVDGTFKLKNNEMSLTVRRLLDSIMELGKPEVPKPEEIRTKMSKIYEVYAPFRVSESTKLDYK